MRRCTAIVAILTLLLCGCGSAPTAPSAHGPATATVPTTPTAAPHAVPAPRQTAVATQDQLRRDWYVTVHGASAVPVRTHAGWSTVTFTFTAQNRGARLRDSRIFQHARLDGLWQGYVYRGRVTLPHVYVAPLFGLVGTAAVQVPTGAVPATQFQFVGPTGTMEFGLVPFYPPMPALPTTSTSQLHFGESVTFPRVASVTPLTQGIGMPYAYGNLISNWSVGVQWTNLRRGDARLDNAGLRFEFLVGRWVGAVAYSDTLQAPALPALAQLHLPLLSRGRAYLLVARPATEDYATYIFTPSVPAQTLRITRQTSPTRRTLYGVSFPDTHHGWAVGAHGTILHTTNGGRTWTAQRSPVTANLRDVYFPTPAEGWAVGTGGTILHTTDGGRRWVAQHGATFDPLTEIEPGGRRYNVQVYSPYGEHLVTRNHGRTWTAAGMGFGGTAYRGLGVIAQAQLFSRAGALLEHWLAGYYGGLAHSAGPRPFLPAVSSGVTSNLLDVAAPAVGQAWVVGASGTLLYTSDDGHTWARPAVTTRNLWGVSFPDATHGWIVGAAGTILRVAPLALP